MESISTEGPVAVTSSSKKIGEYNRKGFTIVTWMNGADFAAEAHEDGVWKWGTGLDSNRGRAERLVEEWIDGEVARREATSAPGPDQLLVAAEAGELLDDALATMIGGWKIEIVDGRGGTYNAVISPAAEHVGEIDEPPTFRGYQKETQALDEATAWAQANPLRLAGRFNGCEWLVLRYCGGSNGEGWTFSVNFPTAAAGVTDMFVGDLIYRTPDDATNEAIGWCSRFKLGEQLPIERAFAEVYPPAVQPAPEVGGAEGVEAIESVVAAEPEPTPAPVAAPPPTPPATVEKAIDEARASGGIQVVEQPAASPALAPSVDVTWTRLQDRKALREEKRRLERELNTRKARIKAIDEELAEIDADLDSFDEHVHDRRQAVLPLSPAPRAEQPAPAPAPPPPIAAKATAMPRQPIRWTANSVELEIMVNGMGEKGFCARVFVQRGNAKQMITGAEGYGETWEQAVEAAKGAASVVLADCDPGETTPKADAGPVADGPRLPPKRGRKPKLKGKTAAEVEAALRGAMTLDEAAKTIGCTAAELEGWAREAGLTLSKHLGADIGGDEPAPKTSKKPRGAGRGKGKK